ncbi:MAG: hypothetical protein LIO50_00015, partial [Phascolarctobacterium sp.]|uniref:hypothetical protein n=1 Tax=Phascolarctobacterium sp. TaxID=2049039 RepID=UPI0025E9C20E
VTWTNRRSLAGIQNIDMAGALTAASITDGTATLTGGAITGLSKVNDVHFVIDKDNQNVAISDEEPWSTNSVIIGIGATATTDGTAIGNQAEANNTDSTAVGMMAKAYGDSSVAVGVGGEAAGDGAIAIGSGANAGHSESVAIGYDSTTSADNQVAFGKMTDPATFRSLAGIKDITLTGAVNGVALGLQGGDGADKGNVLVGGVDVTQMQTDVAGKADTATTLSGYGITDAYTKKEADQAFATVGAVDTLTGNTTGISRTGDGGATTPYVTTIEGVGLSDGSIDIGGKWTYEYYPNDDPQGRFGKYESNGKGALTGVTSINGMNFITDGDNNSILMGVDIDNVAELNNTAIGIKSTVSGDINTLVGANANATGPSAVVFGAFSSATKEGSIAIGTFVDAIGKESIGIGYNVTTNADYTTVIGSMASVYEEAHENSTVVGYSAYAEAKDSVVLGAFAKVA